MEMVEIPKSNIDEEGEEVELEKQKEIPLVEDHETIATQAAESIIINERECLALATKGKLYNGAPFL